MLADKMRSVLDHRGGGRHRRRLSCLMHIGGGLSRLRTGVLRSPSHPRPEIHLRPFTSRDRGASGTIMSTFLGMPAAGCPAQPPTPPSGTCTGDRAFPAAARDALANTQLRRNLAHATSPSEPSGRRGGRGARLGGTARRRRSAIKADTMARLPELLEQLEAQRHRRVAARCTGPATPPRPTASCTDLVRATGADEVVKVKSMATQEIGLNEALEDAGHHRPRDRPGRAHRPARPRQAVPHPRAGDPPRPRRDPRHLRPRDARASTRHLTDEPRRPRRGRPHPPARGVPLAPGSPCPAPTSGSPRPAP